MSTISPQAGYVPPIGEIILYSGVPLNPNHSDVCLLSSQRALKGQLDSYYSPITFSNQTYSRITNGKLRIQAPATRIMTCNYMCWENNIANANNLFFAFITSVEYINVNVSEVSYVIDNYATWFPFLTLGSCFVEREIPANDDLFGNLVPENLELGELTESKLSTDLDLGSTQAVLVASTRPDGSRETSHPDPTYTVYSNINGATSALFYSIFDCHTPEDMDKLDELIERYVTNGYGDNVIAIFLVPAFVTENCMGKQFGRSYASKDWTLQMCKDFEGYQPVNKKLLSYPYNRLVISNDTGQTAEYRYEDFSGAESNIHFNVTGALYGLPSIIVEPNLYKNHIGVDPDYGLMLTNFAQAPTQNDTYKAYLAQNKASIATSILSSIASAGIGVALIAGTGGTAAPFIGASMIASGAGGVASSLAKTADAKASPTTISGMTQADCINLIRDTIKFEAKYVTIKREMAQIIDHYFSAYGYACHDVKIPNIQARSTWSYVQTKGCVLLGSAPYQAKQEIIQNFDAGIRVWRRLQDIGKLHLDNY